MVQLHDWCEILPLVKLKKNQHGHLGYLELKKKCFKLKQFSKTKADNNKNNQLKKGDSILSECQATNDLAQKVVSHYG